jgi:membrane-bound lytic murein transglycosylase A
MRKIQAALAAAALLLTACSSVPPTPSAPSPLPPAPRAGLSAAVAARPCRALHRTLQPAPGPICRWTPDDVAAAAAFLHLPRASGASAGPAWTRVCDLARAADGKPGFDARRFFEQHLQPYSVANGGGAVDGLVTGYYEPLLRGSRTRARGFEQPVRGVPDDLLTIDLSAVFPELKDKRVRGRLEGNKVVPYGRAREIARAASACRAHVLTSQSTVECFFCR